jgi:Transposase DDE domain
MTKILEIKTKIQSFLKLDQRNLEFIALFIKALIEKRTSNINQLSNILNLQVKKKSNARRTRRFLKKPRDWQTQIARWILSFYPGDLMLSLDRTEWMIGKIPVNFLILALTIQSFSFPLIFSLLGKEGSSSTAEVIALLDKVKAWFEGRHVLLLADREFLSQGLLKYLRLTRLNFDFRLKKNAIISYKGHAARPMRWFENLKKGQGSWLKRKVWVYGERVYLIGIRLQKPTEDGDEFVFVVTNACPQAALGLYSYRWGIENLFEVLKTRGFHIEATRIRCAIRLANLLSLLTLALFWAYQTGELISSCEPIRELAHGRLEHSVFRAGLDALERFLRGGLVQGVSWVEVLALLEFDFVGITLLDTS